MSLSRACILDIIYPLCFWDISLFIGKTVPRTRIGWSVWIVLIGSVSSAFPNICLMMCDWSPLVFPPRTVKVIGMFHRSCSLLSSMLNFFCSRCRSAAPSLYSASTWTTGYLYEKQRTQSKELSVLREKPLKYHKTQNSAIVRSIISLQTRRYTQTTIIKTRTKGYQKTHKKTKKPISDLSGSPKFITAFENHKTQWDQFHNNQWY